MPQITAGITKRYGSQFGIKPVFFDPDEAVAKGAAKEAQIHEVKSLAEQGQSVKEIALSTGLSVENVVQAKKTVVTKVATKTYGIEILAGPYVSVVKNMIFKQMSVPFEKISTDLRPAGITDTLSVSLYANDEEHEEYTTLEQSTPVIEKKWKLSRTVSPSDATSVSFRIDDQGKITIYCSIENCTPFELEFTPEGALNDSEMREAKLSLSRIQTS
jgi:molecular chaperone DnaK (HSP70)